jgi:hypothetical protein
VEERREHDGKPVWLEKQLSYRKEIRSLLVDFKGL